MAVCRYGSESVKMLYVFCAHMRMRLADAVVINV